MKVNFYILTFKKKIILFFLLVLVFLSIVNISLVFISKLRTTETNFINEKFSKIQHFNLNKTENLDLVFVGSSKTFYHISSNLFEKNNISVFNLGIGKMLYPDYPSVLSNILIKKPKKVVISISVYSLYDRFLGPHYPTFEELAYYFELDKPMFIYAIKQYFINMHTLLRFSEGIYYRLYSIYESFNFSLSEKDNINSIVSDNSLILQNNAFYSKTLGCDVFDTTRHNNNLIILKCTNGDGILLGENKVKENYNFEIKNLNTKVTKYLKKLINKLTSKDIDLTIILEPLFENYTYSFEDIKKEFPNANIIDLTNLHIDKFKWADSGHFNYLGRKEYTNLLIHMYKNNLL